MNVYLAKIGKTVGVQEAEICKIQESLKKSLASEVQRVFIVYYWD